MVFSMDKIFTVGDRQEEKFLRRKTPAFDFSKFSKNEIRKTVREMRRIMRRAKGRGLSANQVGLNWRMFIAEFSGEKGKIKFYGIFNPVVSRVSSKNIILKEGCLSVPGVWGLVERPERILLEGFDGNEKKIRIKAWGWMARVFQHEVDHLNGVLFIDKAKEIYKEQETNGK